MLRTYDPSKVVVLFGGIPLSGFADGEFVKVERDGDAFSKVVGADGDTSRAKSCNKAGTATITLAQTSPSNDILQGFALLDELSNDGVAPFAVKDLSGRSTYISAHGWIKKAPAVSFGKEITNREWTIDLADIDTFTGGNADAE
jgi:hypothetical protein